MLWIHWPSHSLLKASTVKEMDVKVSLLENALLRERDSLRQPGSESHRNGAKAAILLDLFES